MLESTFKSVQEASRKLPLLKEEKVNQILTALADKAEKNTFKIIEENRKDLERMPESDPKYDRLKLTEQRISDIAKDLRNVATLPSPLHIALEKRTLASGLRGILAAIRPRSGFDQAGQGSLARSGCRGTRQRP